jgi:hypothetical protein
MPGVLQVVVVYNKQNVFGQERDAKLLAEALPIAARAINQRIGAVKLLDAREPPVACDICIHLEIPYAVWFPWARSNVILINSEWWNAEKWTPYMDSFDVAIFRDKFNMDRLGTGMDGKAIFLPWCTKLEAMKQEPEDQEKKFIWFLGGSPNKRAAAEAIVPLWKESYPPLTICSLEPLDAKITGSAASNITFKIGFLDQKVKNIFAKEHLGHICLSRAESYGYVAGEAEILGAFSVLNTLPCYVESYDSSLSPTSTGLTWIKTPLDEEGNADFTNKDELSKELDKMVESFLSVNVNQMQSFKISAFKDRKKRFMDGLGDFLKACIESFETRESIPKHMPPLLNIPDCPPISVVTLVHNRPKFIENACLNLLSTDYPRDKIEWVVIDDSDAELSTSNRIIQFEEKFAPGKITYVPLIKKRSIGYKRNLGVEKAQNSIILMMDDDDHYPSTSFRRRVAYLLKGRKRYDCATCTTIAMYDLMKGVSAVNVPPYNLSLGERCSEATLTFTKSFWNERKFPESNVSEGCEFLKGRENRVVEMPPQQIIVAFSHTANNSGRKMPDASPGCFWGFPKPLLEFFHGLVGIKVEAA